MNPPHFDVLTNMRSEFLGDITAEELEALNAAIHAICVADRANKLLAELRADLARPEGRWGMHGHSAVDDDYFAALEYVVGKLAGIMGDEAKEQAP